MLWHEVHRSIVRPPDHDDRPKSEDQLYPRSSMGGGGEILSLLGGGGGGKIVSLFGGGGS